MATATTINKQAKPAASKPTAHKTSLTSQDHTPEVGDLLIDLLGVSVVVSCWGIGRGWAAASGCSDTLDYKKLVLPHEVNTF